MLAVVSLSVCSVQCEANSVSKVHLWIKDIRLSLTSVGSQKDTFSEECRFGDFPNGQMDTLKKTQ